MLVRSNHLHQAEEEHLLHTTVKSLHADLCMCACNPYSSVKPPVQEWAIGLEWIVFFNQLCMVGSGGLVHRPA